MDMNSHEAILRPLRASGGTAMKQWNNPLRKAKSFHCFIASLFSRRVISCYTGCRRGYITLISVLVVGAVGGAIGISLILLGLGASRSSFAFEQSAQAKALAEACAEEAMQQIHDQSTFTGNGTLTLGQGTCTYAVTSQGGQSRTIVSTGIVGSIVRRERVIVDQITPVIRAASWQDVAD